MKRNRKQKQTGNSDWGIARIGIFISILILLSACIGVVGVTAMEGAEPAKIISWSNAKTGDQKTVFQVSPGESITFSVTAEDGEKCQWLVDGTQQGAIGNSFTWTVPNENGIWKILVKATNSNREQWAQEKQGQIQGWIDNLTEDGKDRFLQDMVDLNVYPECARKEWIVCAVEEGWILGRIVNEPVPQLPVGPASTTGWETEGYLVDGFPEAGGYLITTEFTPTIAFDVFGDGKWTLISGSSYGLLRVYYWDGSQWVSDSSRNKGLVDIGAFAAPTLIPSLTGDGTWTLIAKNGDGEFFGWYWSGTQWISNSARVTGLSGGGARSGQTALYNFKGEDKWTLICGADDGTFTGYYWDGSQWIEDSSRAAGLGDIGRRAKPTADFDVFGAGRWTLITGTEYDFKSFYWDGTQWVSDPSMLDGLKNAGGNKPDKNVAPAVAYNLLGDGKWVLIQGGQSGARYGYLLNTVSIEDNPLIEDVTVTPLLSTVATINWKYDRTWSHRVKYSTNADMSAALWSDWQEDTNSPHNIRLRNLLPETTYYYEAYTYVPWDMDAYARTTIGSFITPSAQGHIQLAPGESIQDAIYSLALEGGIIELLPGTHDVTETVIIDRNNVVIYGTNESIVRHHDPDTHCFHLIDLDPDYVENITFRGFTTTSTYTDWTTYHNAIIRADHTKNVVVENMYDSSYAYSFVVGFGINRAGGASEGTYCRNNIVERGAIYAWYTHHLYQINNTIKAYHAGWSAMGSEEGSHNVHVIGNDITNDGPAHCTITLNAGAMSGGRMWNVRENVGKYSDWGIWIGSGASDRLVMDNTQTGGSLCGFYSRPNVHSNCLVIGNRFYNNKNGMYGAQFVTDNANESVELWMNNVVYSNMDDGIYINGDQWELLEITNNIIVDNGGYGIHRVEGTEGWSNVVSSYNDIWGNGLGRYNNITAGTGDISADPKFVSTTPGEEDFHLRSTGERWDAVNKEWVTDSEYSPCMDVGDPSSDYSNEPDHPNGHINIGVYGNTKEASLGTSAGPDTLPPYTSGHSPAKSATDIPRDTNIVVHIGDDGEGVNQSSIVMTVEGETVSPTITGDKNDYTLTYTPSVLFDYEQVVDITIEAQDLASNDMFLESYSFTLEQATGPTPPTITTHAPTGADVSVATTLSVTFSEAMNETSAENAFSILPSVTGAFSWNGNKMTFTPGTNLDDETLYTVTLGTEAHDLAGNNLETDYNWQFSTISTIIPSGDGLVGWWTLDEDNGDLAHDASGKGNDGTLYGNPIWTTGKINGALDFNGVDDYVRCGRDASLTPEYITVSAWIKPATDGTAYNIVRRDAQHPDYNYEYGFGLGSDGKLELSVGNGTARFSARTSALSWDSTGNTWYHVAATYDGSTTNIYRDGVLEGTDPNGIGAIATEPFYQLFIGRSPVTTLSSFHGSIDEVKIYNRALSSDEILADYQISTGSISGTVTAYGGIIIEEVNVTLATLAGGVIATTQTDYTGHYEFADVAPGFYNLNATKLGYWPDADPVTVTADNSATADISLCQKGDFNTNSEPADAGDLAMMVDATAAGTSDATYDLDGDGNPADAADLTLLKNVSVGVAVLE